MARRRRKSTSRAARLSDALSAINLTPVEEAIEQAREYAQKLEAANDDHAAGLDYTMPGAPDFYAEAEANMDPGEALQADATSAAETVSELHDEIEQWKDNIEEHFSQTQKYSDLEECASALETIKDALEGIRVDEERPGLADGLPMGDEIAALAEKWEAYAEGLEQAKDEVQQAIDEEGSVSFPGMY